METTFVKCQKERGQEKKRKKTKVEIKGATFKGIKKKRERDKKIRNDRVDKKKRTRPREQDKVFF